jgi:hypothetical protein
MKRAFCNPPPVFLATISCAVIGVVWSVFPTTSPPLFREFVGAGWGWATTILPVIASLYGMHVRRDGMKHGGSRGHTPQNGANRLTAGSFEEIIQWIATDDDIRSPQDDRFGHWEIACRVAERLRVAQVGRESTFAILGEVGAGKSSLLALVRARLADLGLLDESLVIASMSLWPFETSDAAIRGVLSAIRKELGRHTSTVGVAGLSGRYLKLVEKVDMRFGLLSDFFGNDMTPRDVLSAYDGLAGKIGMRLVVWIEDLERFASSERQEASAIRALLYQLQQFDNISVVVATAHLDGGLVDPAKIARYIELLPTLSPEQVWPIMQQFRQGCLNLYPDDIPLEMSSGSLFEGPSTNPLMTADMNRSTVSGAITYLCATPRILKQALRAAHESWSRLHGEVNWEHLILISVLRIARPQIFAIVERHIDQLQDGGSARRSFQRKAADGPESFDREFKEACRDSADFDPIKEIIDAVFPGRMHQGGSPPQGLGATAPRDYWMRYLSAAEIANNDRDQYILKAVRDWEAGRSKDLKAVLINPVLETVGAHFASTLGWPALLRLLEDIVADRTCEQQFNWPRNAFGHHAPGLIPVRLAIWRHRSRGSPDMSGLLNLLRVLLDRTVPRNLALAQELQYWFFDAHVSKKNPLLSTEEAHALLAYVKSLLGKFEGEPNKLCAALSGADRWVLGWISFGIGRAGSEAKWTELPFEGWPNLAPTLLVAGERSPAEIVPTVLTFVLRPKDFSDDSKEWVFDVNTAIRLFDLSKLRRLLEAPSLDGIRWNTQDMVMLAAARQGLRSVSEREVDG